MRRHRSPRAHRRIALLWRSGFPRSQDLVVLDEFIQTRLPDSVAPIRATGIA